MVRPAVREPSRPVERAEQALLDSILGGRLPPGAILPGERDLAHDLGVTRPTLREALKRLERDGWLRIRQGRSTEVADFLADGGLNLLPALLRARKASSLASQVQEVRQVILTALVRLAIERDRKSVVDVLSTAAELPDTAPAFAAFERAFERTLAAASGNPVFTLVLNGLHAGGSVRPEGAGRVTARSLYAALLKAARKGDAAEARKVMRDHGKGGRRPSEGGRR